MQTILPHNSPQTDTKIRSYPTTEGSHSSLTFADASEIWR